jgi:hypothetical protein
MRAWRCRAGADGVVDVDVIVDADVVIDGAVDVSATFVVLVVLCRSHTTAPALNPPSSSTTTVALTSTAPSTTTSTSSSTGGQGHIMPRHRYVRYQS